MNNENDDICGLCGQPGADKVKHPEHWPGEENPPGNYVHEACEIAECRRAFLALTPAERAQFLKTL